MITCPNYHDTYGCAYCEKSPFDPETPEDFAAKAIYEHEKKHHRK